VQDFEIIGPISDRETFAQGSGIRELGRLQRDYGRGNWRKCKGAAKIQWHHDGVIEDVEIHWYEAHGIGAFEHRVKP
jgi:hypothetical protein